MKQLAIIPLLLVVLGCSQSKYPSKLQAEQSCEDWGERASEEEYRRCDVEMETNQILGVTYTDNNPRDRVVKHFRY